MCDAVAAFALYVIMYGQCRCTMVAMSGMSTNQPLDPFPFFGWLLNKKAARVEVNISLAFLCWVRIALHP